MNATLERADWVQRLQDFTQRNASRRTVLEVDDPEIGAQEQEFDYELRGVAYDRHDDRIEIMLGPLEGTERHLTHTIAEVTRLDVLSDANGRDQALRILHGGGQTLLRFIADAPIA